MRDKLGLQAVKEGLKSIPERGAFINKTVKPYLAEREKNMDAAIPKRIEELEI